MSTYPSKQSVSAQHQQGAVLIVALVLLTVLTFIAVTALNTSSMEEKMAGNTQESHRSFQTAETGLANTFADSGLFVLTEDAGLAGCAADAGTQLNLNDIGDYSADGVVCTTFIMWTQPPRGSGYSATSFSAAHFEMVSTGTTDSQATTILNAGAFQIAPGGG
ncbi:MAG: hypothetical protein JKY89_02805 [Immundisolibacteraceae bacterium]|nr:hypothetical protein [Immundisolibacteraceae bacterium]